MAILHFEKKLFDQRCKHSKNNYTYKRNIGAQKPIK